MRREAMTKKWKKQEVTFNLTHLEAEVLLQLLRHYNFTWVLQAVRDGMQDNDISASDIERIVGSLEYEVTDQISWSMYPEKRGNK